MSQSAALANLDATLHSAFAAAGMADVGSYLAPGAQAVSVPCRAYLNRGVQQMGDYSQAVGNRDVVTILLADVAKPLKGGVLTLDGATLKLESMTDADESVQHWLVGRV